MQILGTFLIGLLGKVFDFFVSYLGKRLALVLSVITFLAGLAATFFAAMFALLNGIQYSIGNYWLSFAIGVLWPVHVSVCISVVFSAEITRWVYDRSTFYVGLFWESAGR
jgi:hypothetical protein